MQPVNIVDQGFLLLEKTHQPMHVGGMMLFTPPEGVNSADWCNEMVEILRSHDQPIAPFNKYLKRRFGMLFWKTEEHFDAEFHVRHLCLPDPGRIRELLALVSQLHSNLMDRNRPLWEVYVIDGVEGGRVAVYVKIHHAMVDGVAAMRLMQKMLTPDPDNRDTVPVWAMEKKKRGATKHQSAQDMLNTVLGAVTEQAKTLPTVGREVLKSWNAAGNDPDYVSVFQAPKTILNKRVSGSRRFAAQDWPIERIKAAGKKHGATLNDVVLAMCATSLRKYLIDQNALPEKPLICMCPVSLRTDDSTSGNQVAMVLANLATHIDDPLERLKTIKASVNHMKERFADMSQTEIMNYVAAVMSVSGANMAAGVAPEWQAFNVVVSNVPGPKETLYWHGAKLEGTYPVSIVMDGMALNITLNSYADQLEFGLIACRRSLPSMQVLLQYLEDGLTELENAEPAKQLATA